MKIKVEREKMEKKISSMSNQRFVTRTSRSWKEGYLRLLKHRYQS